MRGPCARLLSAWRVIRPRQFRTIFVHPLGLCTGVEPTRAGIGDMGEGKRMQLGGLEPLWIGQLSSGCEQRLSEIDLRGNRPPWSAASFAGEFSNKHALVLGCRFRGELIGFAVIHHIQPEAHLLNFAIAQEVRGLGVGKRLLDFTLNLLKNEGCESLTLEVRRSNNAAQSLYEGSGFEVVGQRPHYYPDDGEDAFVMKLALGVYSDVSINSDSIDSDSIDSNGSIDSNPITGANHPGRDQSTVDS